MANYIQLERTCVRDYSDIDLTIPEAISWLQDHLANIPKADRNQSVFRMTMEHGYYEGDVDCFVDIGFFHNAKDNQND